MRINHIAVYVDDLEGMKEFYRKYFGGVPRVAGDGYYESCVLDPEKNQVEIAE